jgi:predicted esterase
MFHWETSGEDFGHGLARAQLEDAARGGRPLAPGTGLFVWTAKAEGQFHYCVLGRLRDEVEPGAAQAGRNATAAPVGERPAAPGAVQLVATGKAGWYCLQFGDFAEWSRAGADDLWGGTFWSFHVALPEDFKAGEKLPVRLALHGHGAQGARLPAAPKLKDQRLIYLSPQDWQECFWWGWARDIRPAGPDAWPPAQGETRGTFGAIEPYAARRLSRVIAWAAGSPENLAVAPDPERVYLYGHSTGGTGALNFVLSGQKGAERLAGVVATKFPTTWPAGAVWDKPLQRVWGPRGLGLPAAGLGGAAYETVTPLALAKRAALEPPAAEPPLMELSLGTEDEYAPVAELGALAAALEKARIPYFAHWGKYGHSGGRLSGAKNRAFDVKLGEPLLAFANASCNGKPGAGGDATGWLNSALEWSSPADDFDAKSALDDFTDTPGQCAFSVRLASGTDAEYQPGDAKAVATVDITPRRLSKFKPAPGTKCAWTAVPGPVGSGGSIRGPVAAGEAVADARGLVTIPKVPLGKGDRATRVTVTSDVGRH